MNFADDQEAVFHDAARRILAEAQNSTQTVSETTIKQVLYDLLTRRSVLTQTSYQEVKQQIQAYAPLYDKILLSLQFDIPVEVGRNLLWHYIIPKLPRAVKQTIEHQENSYSIDYKEYFTLVCKEDTVKAVGNTVLRFVIALPELMKRLYVLSVQHGDRISLKIPGDMSMLLFHKDSVVVHFCKPELSYIIRTTVEDVFKQNTITLARNYRAESGFDFTHLTLGEKSSHTELIARIMAKHLAQTDLRAATEERLVVWMQSSLAKLNEADPKQMAATLHS